MITLTIKISFANLSKFYKKKSNYSKLSWNFHQIVKLLTNKMPELGRLIQCHSCHQLTYSFLVCLLFLVVGSYNIRFLKDFKWHFKLSPYSLVSKTFPSCPTKDNALLEAKLTHMSKWVSNFLSLLKEQE